MDLRVSRREIAVSGIDAFWLDGSINYRKPRADMMQSWPDHLDKLRPRGTTAGASK
jgi:hypothetical protein